jgi:hypothetical protein
MKTVTHSTSRLPLASLRHGLGLAIQVCGALVLLQHLM